VTNWSPQTVLYFALPPFDGSISTAWRRALRSSMPKPRLHPNAWMQPGSYSCEISCLARLAGPANGTCWRPGDRSKPERGLLPLFSGQYTLYTGYVKFLNVKREGSGRRYWASSPCSAGRHGFASEWRAGFVTTTHSTVTPAFIVQHDVACTGMGYRRCNRVGASSGVECQRGAFTSTEPARCAEVSWTAASHRERPSCLQGCVGV